MAAPVKQIIEEELQRILAPIEGYDPDVMRMMTKKISREIQYRVKRLHYHRYASRSTLLQIVVKYNHVCTCIVQPQCCAFVLSVYDDKSSFDGAKKQARVC